MSASSGQKREPSPTNQSGDSHVDKSPVPIVQEEDDIQSVVEQQLGDLTLKSDSEEKSVSVADACVSGMMGPKSGETLIDKLYSVPSSGRYSSQPVPKVSKEEYKLCRTCKVVYIEEAVNSRRCAGHLKAYDKVNRLALLSPRDKKLPRVVVPLDDCPKDYVQNLKKYETSLFVCHIKEWHRKLPFASGRLVFSLGEAGQIEAESEALLLENGVNFEGFPDGALKCLPQEIPWKFPPVSGY